MPRLMWAGAVLLGVGIAVGFNAAVLTVAQVESESMAPTLVAGQTIAVWKPGDVARFDIVSFDGRGSFIPRDHARVMFVKRVIGMPGDRVTCCDSQGLVSVNGTPMPEPYLANGNAGEMSFDVIVPPEKLWLMGDNRNESRDSRAFLGAPGGGFVPLARVQGQVVGVLAPPGDFRWWGPTATLDPSEASG